MARLFALSGLRSRYPNASEAEIRRRLADLILGEELAAEVYGPLEENINCMVWRDGRFRH